MSTNQLNYPAFSNNPNRNRSSFWKGMGLKSGHPDDLSTIADTLLRAPVARYSDDGYIVSRPGSGQEAEGKISLAAAQRILGKAVSKQDEVVIRMLEAGSSPESVRTYDATFEVEELSQDHRENIPRGYADPLMLDDVPDGFELGADYDFTVLHHHRDEEDDTGQYIIADPDTAQSRSDWR